jgi:hypothetical protein
LALDCNQSPGIIWMKLFSTQKKKWNSPLMV